MNEHRRPDVQVAIADPAEHTAAQRFYASRGYGGAAIAATDVVVIARQQVDIVGVGRLCQEGDLLWLRGMQVAPAFQRVGVGGRILQLLDQQIGQRRCCCLPYAHLVAFYRRAGFDVVEDDLPPAMAARLSEYLGRGLDVVPMVREAR